MARKFRPDTPYAVPMMLQAPTTTIVKGTEVKTYTDVGQINCSFRSYGGTEQTTNDVYTVLDTAYVETWYRPDIASDCRVVLLPSGKAYEILGEVEDIEMRHQYARFKVRAVTGGV